MGSLVARSLECNILSECGTRASLGNFQPLLPPMMNSEVPPQLFFLKPLKKHTTYRSCKAPAKQPRASRRLSARKSTTTHANLEESESVKLSRGATPQWAFQRWKPSSSGMATGGDRCWVDVETTGIIRTATVIILYEKHK